MAHETAGDPHSGLKWTRRTTAKLADRLRTLDIDVCPRTVARLLKAMGYSLRVNHKKRAGAAHPNRNAQFEHITELRQRCAADNVPVISIDTKKKELVGVFRNPGAKWTPHHFASSIVVFRRSASDWFDPSTRARDRSVTATGDSRAVETAPEGDGCRQGPPKALASLGSRSPRTVGRGRQPTSRVLRCAPVQRMTATADRAGSLAGQPEGWPAIHCLQVRRLRAAPLSRSTVDNSRTGSHAPSGRERRPRAIRTPGATGRGPAHVEAIAARCGSKQAPSRSIAQATLSRRSATERRARACPWPRARSARYLPWLAGSRWAATRAQW